jgi:hypothetical protein
MSAAKHTPGKWRISIVRASKARAATRIWIVNGRGDRSGYFPTEQVAQAECDRLNAAIAQDTRSAA